MSQKTSTSNGQILCLQQRVKELEQTVSELEQQRDTVAEQLDQEANNKPNFYRQKTEKVDDFCKRILSKPTTLYKFTKMTPNLFALYEKEYKQYIKDESIRERRNDQLNKRRKEKLDGEPKIPQYSGVNVGRGKVSVLSTTAVMLMEFMSTRAGMTQDVIGSIFDMSQSNVSRHTRHVRRFLNQSWTRPIDIADQISKCKTLQDLREWIPRLKTAIDGTHFIIDIPSDSQLETWSRSGKLKKHTCVILVMVNKEKLILTMSPLYYGSTHEITILKEWKLGFGKWEDKMRDPSTPRKERIKMRQDSAYQGGESVFPGTNFIVPFKKPRGGELTKEQKEFNRDHSSERVVVENSIGMIKQYRHMQQQIECVEPDLEKRIEEVAALVNAGILWDKRRDRPTKRFDKLLRAYHRRANKLRKRYG